MSVNDEVWRVPLCAPWFEISSLGRVKSVRYGRILKPSNNGNGYRYVCKYFKENTKHFYIHRLVADAFILNPNKYPEVNHLNGDKQDNRACNLEWCNASRNIRHAHETGLISFSGDRINKLKKAGKLNYYKTFDARKRGWDKWNDSLPQDERRKRIKNLSMRAAEKNRRKVEQLTAQGSAIQVFSSVGEAAQAVGAHSADISHCCSGRTKLCKGYAWRYI